MLFFIFSYHKLRRVLAANLDVCWGATVFTLVVWMLPYACRMRGRTTLLRLRVAWCVCRVWCALSCMSLHICRMLSCLWLTRVRFYVLLYVFRMLPHSGCRMPYSVCHCSCWSSVCMPHALPCPCALVLFGIIPCVSYLARFLCRPSMHVTRSSLHVLCVPFRFFFSTVCDTVFCHAAWFCACCHVHCCACFSVRWNALNFSLLSNFMSFLLS